MKLAFGTNAYTRFSLIDALRGIKSAGFPAVEILADVPHAYPGTLDSGLIWEIARELERLDLRVSNINANCAFGYWRHAPPEPYFEPSILSPDSQHREDRLQLIFKALELGKAVNAEAVSITSGRMLGGMPPKSAERQFEDSMRRVLDRADQLGVNVGIECEPGLFIEFASELRAWIDRLNHPRLGANLDVGHSQVMGESIPDSVRLLSDRIWNLHVEDIPGRKHFHLIPGDEGGTMDWPGLFHALQEIDYRRYLTVELYTQNEHPQEAAEKSFAFLTRLLES